MRIHAGTHDTDRNYDQDGFSHLTCRCECRHHRTREGHFISNRCEAVPQGKRRVGENGQAYRHPLAPELRARIETGPGQEWPLCPCTPDAARQERTEKTAHLSWAGDPGYRAQATRRTQREDEHATGHRPAHPDATTP